MVRQIILYVAIIAFLLFILTMTGSTLFLTLSGAAANRSTLSFDTASPTLTTPTQSSHSTVGPDTLPSSVAGIHLTPSKTVSEHSSAPMPSATVTIRVTPNHSMIDSGTEVLSPIEPSITAETSPLPEISPTINLTLEKDTATSEPTPTAMVTTNHELSETPTGTGICGLSQPLDFLFIHYGDKINPLSSAMISLVHISPQEMTISVVSIPCDMWVDSTSLVKDYTISGTKICPLIQLAIKSPKNESLNDSIHQNINLSLNDTFNINTPSYILSDSQSINNIIQLFGKIEYFSPQNQIISGVPLTKGNNSLNTVAILHLMGPDMRDASLWEKIYRQNDILRSFLVSYQSSGISINDLVSVGVINSNLDSDQLGSLDCLLKKISSEQISFSDIIRQYSYPDDFSIIRIRDKTSLIQEIKKILQ